MTIFSQIVPGKVNNLGVNDVSIPTYSTTMSTRPLHLPIVHVVTPQGPLAADEGTAWVNTADFKTIFGNILDPKTAYYNPTSVLISQMAAAGQATIGVRRLAANHKVARIPLSAFVQQMDVPQYERDAYGQFKLDANGDKVPTGETLPGLKVVIAFDDEGANVEPGELKVREIAGATGDDPTTQVFPLFELLAGVGDVYNLNGVNLGLRDSTSTWKTTEPFVEDTGVYPFNMRQFIDSATGGQRTFVKTSTNSDTCVFTLFETEYNNTRYSLDQCIKTYTNTVANRPTTKRPAPFGDDIIYQDNINTLCQMMYAVEKDNNTNLVENLTPYKQMNPFTCVDHLGQPYNAIIGDDISTWDMSYAMNAQYGISPFCDDEGNMSSLATVTPVNDPFGILGDVTYPITMAQGWEINNGLILSDLTTFVDSMDQSNYTRNRQSIFWDVGYDYDVKQKAMELLGVRKDIAVCLDATIWVPGEENLLSDIYSRLSSLSTEARMYPESEYWGTPTMRSMINIIEAKVIDEATGYYFSGNIDIAYAFARFGGNEQGYIKSAYCPDTGDNRILTVMHSPNIEFESDDTASNNLDLGGVTLRPYDNDLMFRPCLPTVYSNVDSVLKDFVTAFLFVCIEKISQDEWNTVCGSTQLSAANYQALVKDGIERKCRDRLGGVAKQITAECTYNETVAGGRAVMNTVVHAYFNKGKYMMNLTLYAHNEEELNSN